MPAGFDAVRLPDARPALRFGAGASRRSRSPKARSRSRSRPARPGTPKGVCLGAKAMLDVAAGLAEALAPLRIERHLAALPFPLLLENLAGAVRPAVAGIDRDRAAAARRRTDRLVDFRSRRGSTPLRPRGKRTASSCCRRCCEPGRGSERTRRQASMRYASSPWRAHRPASRSSLQRAQPAFRRYEGYGLSEGASVQTLNLPGADRPGSVGRALPACARARHRATARSRSAAR